MMSYECLQTVHLLFSVYVSVAGIPFLSSCMDLIAGFTPSEKAGPQFEGCFSLLRMSLLLITNSPECISVDEDRHDARQIENA